MKIFKLYQIYFRTFGGFEKETNICFMSEKAAKKFVCERNQLLYVNKSSNLNCEYFVKEISKKIYSSYSEYNNLTNSELQK